MTTAPRTPVPPPAPTEREPRVGLRLRLWLACISGGAIAGLGSLWVLGTRVHPDSGGGSDLLAWLVAVAFGAVLAGLVMGLWLDHHVVSHLRGLLRGMASGRVTELRGLPSASGWGEISELTEVAQSLLARQRQNARAGEELELLREQLAALSEAVEQWLRSEAWESPALARGPVGELGDALARGFARRGVVEAQNVQAAQQVAEELAAALGDAQESAEQAERGFVEATAMLTTVRELQRLSGELHTALGAVGERGPAAESGVARAALEELVQASQESVDAIGRAMLRVQEVSELVQQLANRATLVAIHAVSGSRPVASEDDDVTRELKQLVRDVREATDRTSQFAHDIESAVGEASSRMQGARERAATRLEEKPAAPAPANAARAVDDAQRLLERVREMVQDAARKGERLSAAGERASRAAERLARRIGEETGESQALAMRLRPVGAEPGRPAAESRELRLLEERPEENAERAANESAEDVEREPGREEELP
jgi:ABC-type transporter Mla subunit MlaD